jgi:hypothetical protein
MRPLSIALLAVPLLACRQEMYDQPKLTAFQRSSFFDDGRASRPKVPGTVARGELVLDEHLQTGRIDGELASTFPFPIDRAVLERGRERYGIFCTPCHDASGSGDGMVVRRGMKRPTSFHAERLRAAPPGHFFDVITNGFGAMFDYADRITPRDRWAIVAYVRALQASQSASLVDVPDAERARLEEERP